jgi:PAS domain S-box-containing protein
MKIKSKLFIVFLGMFLLEVAGVGFHRYRDRERIIEDTISHAEHTAKTIAFSISREGEETKILPLYINPIELQKYVKDLHEFKKLDLVIVDVHRKILADVIPKNVGTVFDHDQGNEVGQTIKDGVTRTFIEKSPHYPERINLIAIPLKTEDGQTKGAVILEYGSILDAALAKEKEKAVIVGILFLTIMPLILVLGYIFSSAVINPIITLRKTVDEIAGGNLDAKVELKTKDEINDLAVSFNKMTEELAMHRNRLEDLVEARTSEIRKVNKELQNEITERKRAEEGIKQNLSLLNATLESTADGILVVDRKGKIERFNRKFVQMWRIPESIIPSQDDNRALGFVLDQLKNPQGFLTKVRELYNHPAAESFDILEFKDGRVFERFSQPQMIGDQSVGRVWSFRDITERNRAEEALRESEDRYRDLVEFSEYLICTHDLEGKILSINQGAAKILGYDQSDLLYKNIRDYLFPEVRGEFDQYLDTILKQGISNGVMLVQTATGEKRIWEYNNSLRTEGVTEPIVRSIAHDITERKQMEQTLIRSEETAKRLSQENEIIAEIGRIISSTLNIEEVYERFTEGVKKLIPFDRIVINIINIEKSTVSNVYMAGKGIADRKVGVIYPLEGSGNVEMVCTKSSLLIQTEDFDEYKDRFPMLLSTFQAGFRSIMNVPLFSKGKIIGGLLLRSLKPYAYTDKDVRLAERVGNQIAGAIANAQLFIERKRVGEERERLILQLQDALAEVKQLSGLLPICASCKKIRDDKGYWNQIEEYIRDRSEAEFSHSICPDCMKKLYPDL